MRIIQIRISLAFLLFSALAFGQTGQCHGGSNAGNPCTSDAACTGGGYCAVLKHVIFVIKENRSMDQMFGSFPGVTGGPTTTAPCVGTSGGCSNGTFDLRQADPSAGDSDCGHANSSGIIAVNSGAMNQFNKTCGGGTGECNGSGASCTLNSDCGSGDYCSTNAWANQYNATTIPYYWSLATNYGLADHMFSSMLGPSLPNHLFIIAATANEINTNADYQGGTDTCDASPPTGVTNPNTPGGTCLKSGGACNINSDCTSAIGDNCSNGNLYQVTTIGSTSEFATDLLGGTGATYNPGVCLNHPTVSCTTLSGDNSCALINDTCDTTRTLAASRGAICLNVTTIADVLDAAAVSWGQFSGDTKTFRNPFNSIQHIRYGLDEANATYTDTQFQTNAAACNSHTCTDIPAVSWVIANSQNSEHPPNTVSDGEAWTKNVVSSVMFNSYLWDTSAIFVTWDDWGGFYDHLAPRVDPQNYTEGIRVPLLCVGQYCKNQIISTQFTYQSLLKCIENNWGIANLGLGDATANDVCSGSGGMIDLSLSNDHLRAATTTTLTSSPGNSVYGQAVTLTASVSGSGGTATGSVTFKADGTNSLGSASLASGTAALTSSVLTAGTHTVIASYGGDSNFSPSSSGSLSQMVVKATSKTSLSSSPNPSTFGQGVTLLAAVTSQYGGLATGSVIFTADGTTTLGAATLNNGSAALTTAMLTVGTHTITGSYSGDSNVLSSTSPPLRQMVNKGTTTTALASSGNPVAPNQSVTYTATVTGQYAGAVSGTITFSDGSTAVATISLVGSQAVYTTSYTKTGSHAMTATYSGDINNLGSSSSVLTEYVEILPVSTTTTMTTSGSPSTINQPVALIATVASTYGTIPNGELVTFYDGTTKIGTGTTSGGKATFTTSTLSVKTHTIKGTYAGDSTFKASSGTVQQIVNGFTTTTTLTTSPNPTAYGAAVALTAQVTTMGSTMPTGTVNFKNGTTSLGSGTLNSSGVATLSTTKLPLGTSSLTATYNGDASNGASTSTAVRQKVNQALVNMTLTSTPNPSNSGQSVKFTAILTSNGSLPTGTVSFSYNGSTLGMGTISGGKATLSTTALPVGSDTVMATYAGSADYSSASASISQTVN